MAGINSRIQLSKSAKRDLNSRWNWLAQESSPAIADRFLDAVDNTIQLLRTHPHAGRISRLRDGTVTIRRITVDSPFERLLIFYTVRPSEIRIERVLHGARNWVKSLL